LRSEPLSRVRAEELPSNDGIHVGTCEDLGLHLDGVPTRILGGTERLRALDTGGIDPSTCLILILETCWGRLPS